MILQKRSMVENWASVGARGLSSDTAILNIHSFFSNKEVGHLQTDNPGTIKTGYHPVRVS